jgi:ASCH domain-containing protein
MELLFALSIRQPWLDMILRGVKSMEVRTWEIRRKGLIALHSPWMIDFGAAYFYGYQEPWKLPRGRIVGTAEVTDVLQLDESSWRECLQLHRQPVPMMSGAFGITLRDVRILPKPLPYRGRQMLFPLDEQASNHVLQNVSS